ncbi:MAG TPA: hypothetical protein PKY47_04970 [Acetomicrobium sp.]|uniref:hypothetical protein n=1 Tax=Acetomicrobium mobile TaxID=97477 RepID=UPI0026F1EA85|nr:hypothetical protein [Acetomicrobium mobile]HOB11102.1 hypothetical protein [Acetomicrobium sp.]HQA36702.1 hypothetical protein [Acetomicrobium sp.]
MTTNPADFDQAELTDDEGRLASPVGARGGIWVPPDAKLEFVEGKPYIFYPVPKNWPSTVSIQQLNFEELKKLGWAYKESTDKLLDDFVALANATPNKVLKFVKKWGPLWACVSHSTHKAELAGVMGVEIVSLIQPVGPLHGDATLGFSWCSWVPAEDVSTFVMEAKRAKAALSIYTCLKLKKEEDPTDWATLGFVGKLKFAGTASAEEKKFIKKMFLCSFVESRLSEVGFSIDPQDLKLQIVSDLGFLRTAWLQLAQAMTGMRGIYVCDGCGKVYVRALKKPAKGRLNFCPDCGEGKRGSKRAYYRRKKNAF